MDLVKTENQLKYLYLIDTDSIIAKLTSQIDFSKDNIEVFFSKIFNCIFESASLYTEYLDPAAFSKTFFGTSTSAYALNELLSIIKASLKNNFILYSYFNLLYEKNQNIEVSAPNSPYLQKGYNSSITLLGSKNTPTVSSEFVKVLPGEVDSFQFYRRKSIIKKTAFPKSLITCLNLDDTKKLKTNCLYGTLCDFLITQHYVTSFSRKISPVDSENPRHSSCINIYNKLYDAYYHAQKNINDFHSKIIFCSQMNLLYGFDFFYYLSHYLNNLHSFPIKKGFSLKDIEGQQLLYSLQTLSELPLFYNKHLFLEYALLALETGTDFTCYYLENNPAFPAKRIQNLNNKPLQTERSLNLLEKFFRTLKDITLPILLSLWMVTINKLLDTQTINVAILESKLKKYIDYNSNNLNDSNSGIYTSCYLKNDYFTTQYNLHNFCPSKEEFTTIPFNIEKSVRDSLDMLVRHYNHRDSQEKYYGFSYFCDVASYSPLDKLYFEIQKDYHALNSKTNLLSLEYLSSFRFNLHEFIFKK